jgi:hypothetical protein
MAKATKSKEIPVTVTESEKVIDKREIFKESVERDAELDKVSSESAEPVFFESPEPYPVIPPEEIEPAKEAFEKEPIVGTPEVVVSESKIVIPEPPKPIYRKELDNNLPFDERIVAFLESRGKSGTIKLNDFLKSLYPLPKLNEPPKWNDQGEMKRLRVILDNMKSHRAIDFVNNQHSKLGQHYYEGEQQYARFHNLNTVTIEARL